MSPCRSIGFTRGLGRLVPLPPKIEGTEWARSSRMTEFGPWDRGQVPETNPGLAYVV